MTVEQVNAALAAGAGAAQPRDGVTDIMARVIAQEYQEADQVILIEVQAKHHGRAFRCVDAVTRRVLSDATALGVILADSAKPPEAQ